MPPLWARTRARWMAVESGAMPGMRTRLSTKSRRHVGVLDHRGSDSRRHWDRCRLLWLWPPHLDAGSGLLRRNGDSDDCDGPATTGVCRRSALLEPAVLARSGRPHSAYVLRDRTELSETFRPTSASPRTT